jgi:GT2 family glycosyltransferase
MSATPLVSIIVVTYNSAHRLPALAASFDADPGMVACELIVVDNGSTDTPAPLLPTAQWLVLPGNLGYGSACNRGATLARGEYVVFCNPDILVTPYWCQRLVAHLDAHPSVACITPETRYPGESIPLGTGVADRDALPGAAFMMRRADWQALGGFDEQFFLYWEDTDLCWRAQRAGRRTVVARDVEITHLRNGSGGGAQTWLHLYIQNGIYAHLKSQSWARVVWFVGKQLIALPGRLLRSRDRRLLAAFGWNIRHRARTLRSRRSILAGLDVPTKGTP